MWTRAELKHRGKAAFKSNYWKTVLVAAILSLLTYSSSLPRGSSDSSSEGLSETTRMLADPASALSTNSQLVAGFFVGIGLTALVVIAVLGILIGVLLVLPLQVGCQRFLFLNLREPANVREVLWAFDSNYLNIVKVMFLKNLKIFAWALLLVIPGIVKAYEYRLVDYLLAENPALSSAEACEQSRTLMDGNSGMPLCLTCRSLAGTSFRTSRLDLSASSMPRPTRTAPMQRCTRPFVTGTTRHLLCPRNKAHLSPTSKAPPRGSGTGASCLSSD